MVKGGNVLRGSDLQILINKGLMGGGGGRDLAVKGLAFTGIMLSSFSKVMTTLPMRSRDEKYRYA